MAYTFNGTNQYLSTASSPASGSPMTICAFFNQTTSHFGTIVSVGESSGTHRNQLFVSFNLLSVCIGTSSSGNFSGGAALANNTWYHGCLVCESNSSRSLYQNGQFLSTNTVNIGTQNTANSILVGARVDNSVARFFSGNIAEVGVWDIALTAAEIASLAKGMTCDKVRPQNLVFYAPLVRDLQDVRGGLTITNNNAATVADHPRVYA